MQILNIAEKPSIAKSISSLLNTNYKSTKSHYKYCPFYKFPYKIQETEVQFTFTAVLGHLYTYGLSGNINNDRIYTRINNSLIEPNKLDCWKTENPIEMYDYPLTFTTNQDDLIKNLKTTADIIIIWTDNDREGEHIAREIADTIGPHFGITKKYGIVKSTEYDLKKVRYQNHQTPIFPLEEIIRKDSYKIYRAKFSEVSENAIKMALNNLTLINFDEVNAVDTRIQMDLRTGFCLTRILTENLLKEAKDLETNKDINILSYGSCQIPTLGFVVDRFLQVVSFKPEDFYTLKIELPCLYKRECCKETQKSTFTVKWSRNLFEKNAMISFYEKFLNQSPLIEIIKTESTVHKPSGLNTTKLISLCSSVLKISSDATMKIAESLYTKGFISYPRTETNSYPGDFDFKKSLKPFKSTTFKRKLCCVEKEIPVKFYSAPFGNRNDQAHLPIYPIKPYHGELQELRVFNLILEQFAASLHENGVDSVTKITVSFGNETFKGEYRKAKKLGFREILFQGCENRELFLEERQFYELKQVVDKTKPPKLLTETDLINLMDKHEIGTDATIHEHIKKVLDRKYVFKESVFLVPSFVGVALINSFESLKELYKPFFRAEFEKNLKRIAISETEKEDVLKKEILRYKRITECILREIERYKREFRETHKKYGKYVEKLNFSGSRSSFVGNISSFVGNTTSFVGNKGNKENKNSSSIIIETIPNKKDLPLKIETSPLKKQDVENNVKYKPFNDQQCNCGFDTKRVISKTPQNMFRIFWFVKKNIKNVNTSNGKTHRFLNKTIHEFLLKKRLIIFY